jgi:asparagine synthase (glutamine-hydrolysing)
MCGIAGYIGKKNIDRSLINKSLKLLENRGPDFKNFTEYNCNFNGKKKIFFLHTRLSIIDLNDRSNQPFEDGNYSIIYNGEIYNYLELRKELISIGVKFKTFSDTEVLLKSYIHYGVKFLDKIEGMWSFAIYDKSREKIILSRDRFGEKPLYYSLTDDGFYFSSDIRVIKCLSEKQFSKNIKKITSYVVSGYKSLYKNLSETYYENIYQVTSSNYLEIDKKFKVKSHPYWMLKIKDQKKIHPTEILKKSKKLLFESIKTKLRSDVPLAFCLSGGVDSGALVSIAKKEFNVKINSFSIIENKDERYSEKKNIDKVVKDCACNHTEVDLSKIKNNLKNLNRLKKLVKYKSSPLCTISYFLHSFMSESISKKGFKVAFSGTGADEIYSGYYDHHLQYLYDTRRNKDFEINKKNFIKYVKPYIRNEHLKKYDLYIKNKNFRKHIYDNSNEFQNLLKKDFKKNLNLEFYEHPFNVRSLLKKRALNELFYEIVPPILSEDDTNSMFFSLENRSPYLDRKLCEFMFSVPVNNLINNGYAKNILRESAYGYLHDDIRLERKKKGFNASVNNVFDFSDRNFINEILNKKSEIFDIFDYDKIKKIFKKDISLNHYSKFIFSFINAKLFLEN